jgi:hypothetical protein
MRTALRLNVGERYVLFFFYSTAIATSIVYALNRRCQVKNFVQVSGNSQ